MARSPRSSAPSSNSVMAVDLPVPVVPMTLKCLVSSAAPTTTPASANVRAPLQDRKSDIRFHARHPDSTRAPRLYRSMASITSDDEIVRLVSVCRRLPVDADAQSTPVAAALQINSSALLLEARNLRNQRVAPRAKRRDFGAGGDEPTPHQQRNGRA